MKKRVFAWLTLALALVMAVGSVTFLGACVHEDGSFGACHWASRALLGIGILLAAQSGIALATGHAGAYLCMAFTAALGLLLPGTLIRLCGMATMHCRAVMQPAMTLLNAGILILALAGFLLETRRAKRGTP